MNLLVARLAGLRTNDIQVSGFADFPEARWREAILFYLFGMWSGKLEVTFRRKIAFGDVTLRLDLETHEYFAYGRSYEELSYPLPIREDERLYAQPKQVEVEMALVRFVKNERIKLLTIFLSSGGRLMLWKKLRRGQYGYAAIDIPSNWCGLGPGKGLAMG